MDYIDFAYQRHLACLASFSRHKLAVDPTKLTGIPLIDKPASYPSTPTSTVTIPLKLVVSSDPPASNLSSPTDNIPWVGKALFRDFEMDHKEKSSVINRMIRIEILENQVTDLHQKFDQLDHKFDLLLSMLMPLITTHSVVCTPSQAAKIKPFSHVKDSPVNNLPPAPITVSSDLSVLQPEMQHIDQARCTQSLDWHYSAHQGAT